MFDRDFGDRDPDSGGHRGRALAWMNADMIHQIMLARIPTTPARVIQRKGVPILSGSLNDSHETHPQIPG